MQEIIDQFRNALGEFGPNILAALVILIVGWILALLVSSAVRNVLGRTTIDNRLAAWLAGSQRGEPIRIEIWVARVIFYLIMLIVLVAFFETLRLTTVTTPLNEIVTAFTAYLPRLLAALVLAIIAWALAIVVRKLTAGALDAVKFDERLAAKTADESAPSDARPLSSTISQAAYWLVFLLFLPPILGALELQSLLEPVQNMFNRFFEYLPNLIAGAAILLVGWFVARIVQRIVTSLLSLSGLDKMSEKWGIATALGKQTLSKLLGQVLFYIILLPVFVAALNALQIEALSRPASNMLGQIMGYLPGFFGAIVVLVLAYIIGRVVSGLFNTILTGVGFNTLPARIGLSKMPTEGERAPSAMMGTLAMVIIILFAAIEAARLMELTMVADMLSRFMVFGGHVLMGLIILALGLFLANWVARTIEGSGTPRSRILALIAKVTILLLVGAMALRQMELANEIVHLAFGLLLGSVAVAAAIAFGLGGREHAAKMIEDWRKSGSGDQNR